MGIKRTKRGFLLNQNNKTEEIIQSFSFKEAILPIHLQNLHI